MMFRQKQITISIKREMRAAIALTTAACFLCSFVAGPVLATVTNNTSDEKKMSLALEDTLLPCSLGRITDAQYFGSEKVVVAIQDLHCHPEVQRNIARILAAFDRQCRLNRVYVEGAAGDVNTSWLTAITDEELQKKVIESLLDGGRLSGSEYYSIIARKPLLIKGIENEQVYDGNIKRLGRILKEYQGVTELLPVLRRDLQRMKEKYYTAENKKLERILERHADNGMEAGRYYRSLQKYARTQHLRESDFRNLTLFLELLELQKGLNYRKIGKEMTAYVGTLKSRLPYGAYTALMQKAKDGEQLDELYVSLAQITRQMGVITGSRYRHLEKFFAFIEANGRLNTVELVREERNLIRALHEKMAKSEGEREIACIEDLYGYLEEFLAGRITPEDRAYLSENLPKFKTLWAKYVYTGALRDLEPYCDLLEEFYRVNADRNMFFVKNVLGKMPAGAPAMRFTDSVGHQSKVIRSIKEGKELVVMVTGGFHTKGVTDLLKDSEVSYLVVTPNVTQNTQIPDAVYREIARYQSRILSQTMALRVLTQSPLDEAMQNLAKESISVLLQEGWEKEKIEEEIRAKVIQPVRDEFRDRLGEKYANLDVSFSLQDVHKNGAGQFDFSFTLNVGNATARYTVRGNSISLMDDPSPDSVFAGAMELVPEPVIVSDIDGTLVMDNGGIPDMLVDYIVHVLERGMPYVPLTSRTKGVDKKLLNRIIEKVGTRKYLLNNLYLLLYEGDEMWAYDRDAGAFVLKYRLDLAEELGTDHAALMKIIAEELSRFNDAEEIAPRGTQLNTERSDQISLMLLGAAETDEDKKKRFDPDRGRREKLIERIDHRLPRELKDKLNIKAAGTTTIEVKLKDSSRNGGIDRLFETVTSLGDRPVIYFGDRFDERGNDRSILQNARVKVVVNVGEKALTPLDAPGKIVVNAENRNILGTARYLRILADSSRFSRFDRAVTALGFVRQQIDMILEHALQIAGRNNPLQLARKLTDAVLADAAREPEVLPEGETEPYHDLVQLMEQMAVAHEDEFAKLGIEPLLDNVVVTAVAGNSIPVQDTKGSVIGVSFATIMMKDGKVIFYVSEAVFRALLRYADKADIHSVLQMLVRHELREYIYLHIDNPPGKRSFINFHSENIEEYGDLFHFGMELVRLAGEKVQGPDENIISLKVRPYVPEKELAIQMIAESAGRDGDRIGLNVLLGLFIDTEIEFNAANSAIKDLGAGEAEMMTFYERVKAETPSLRRVVNRAIMELKGRQSWERSIGFPYNSFIGIASLGLAAETLFLSGPAKAADMLPPSASQFIPPLPELLIFIGGIIVALYAYVHAAPGINKMVNNARQRLFPYQYWLAGYRSKKFGDRSAFIVPLVALGNKAFLPVLLNDTPRNKREFATAREALNSLGASEDQQYEYYAKAFENDFEAAIPVLAELGDKRAISLLLSRMKPGRFLLTKDALIKLGASSDQLFEYYGKALEKGFDSAIALMGELGDKRAIPLLMNRPQEGRFSVTKAALIKLGASPEDLFEYYSRALRNSLFYTSKPYQKNLIDAVSGLGDLGDKKALPLILAMPQSEYRFETTKNVLIRLGASYDQLHDYYVKALENGYEAAIPALTELGTPAADKILTDQTEIGPVKLDRETGRIFYSDKAPVKTEFEFWAVRHGETSGNVQNYFQGSDSDEEPNQLNATGREQAEKAALKLFDTLKGKILSGEELVIVTSSASRARDTAAAFIRLVEERTGKVLVPVVNELANEIRFGDWHNRALEDLQGEERSRATRYRQELDATMKSGHPEAENFFELIARALKFIEELNARYKGRTVVVFGHGTYFGAVRALLKDRALIDDAGYFDWRSKGRSLPNAMPVQLAAKAAAEETPAGKNGAGEAKVSRGLPYIREVKRAVQITSPLSVDHLAGEVKSVLAVDYPILRIAPGLFGKKYFLMVPEVTGEARYRATGIAGKNMSVYVITSLPEGKDTTGLVQLSEIGSKGMTGDRYLDVYGEKLETERGTAWVVYYKEEGEGAVAAERAELAVAKLMAGNVPIQKALGEYQGLPIDVVETGSLLSHPLVVSDELSYDTVFAETMYLYNGRLGEGRILPAGVRIPTEYREAILKKGAAMLAMRGKLFNWVLSNGRDISGSLNVYEGLSRIKKAQLEVRRDPSVSERLDASKFSSAEELIVYMKEQSGIGIDTFVLTGTLGMKQGVLQQVIEGIHEKDGRRVNVYVEAGFAGMKGAKEAETQVLNAVWLGADGYRIDLTQYNDEGAAEELAIWWKMLKSRAEEMLGRKVGMAIVEPVIKKENIAKVTERLIGEEGATRVVVQRPDAAVVGGGKDVWREIRLENYVEDPSGKIVMMAVDVEVGSETVLKEKFEELLKSDNGTVGFDGGLSVSVKGDGRFDIASYFAQLVRERLKREEEAKTPEERYAEAREEALSMEMGTMRDEDRNAIMTLLGKYVDGADLENNSYAEEARALVEKLAGDQWQAMKRYVNRYYGLVSAHDAKAEKLKYNSQIAGVLRGILEQEAGRRLIDEGMPYANAEDREKFQWLAVELELATGKRIEVPGRAGEDEKIRYYETLMVELPPETLEADLVQAVAEVQRMKEFARGNPTGAEITAKMKVPVSRLWEALRKEGRRPSLRAITALLEVLDVFGDREFDLGSRVKETTGDILPAAVEAIRSAA